MAFHPLMPGWLQSTPLGQCGQHVTQQVAAGDGAVNITHNLGDDHTRTRVEGQYQKHSTSGGQIASLGHTGRNRSALHDLEQTPCSCSAHVAVPEPNPAQVHGPFHGPFHCNTTDCAGYGCDNDGYPVDTLPSPPP